MRSPLPGRCLPKLAVGFALLVVSVGTAAIRGESPPLPHSVFGLVTGDGTVLAGMSVGAFVAGVEVAQATTFETPDGIGFTLAVPGDLAGTSPVEGATPGQEVELAVGGASVSQQLVWSPGAHQRVDLEVPIGPDLAISIDDGVPALYPGLATTYALEVANRSEVAAAGVMMRAPLPELLEFEDAGDGALEEGAVVVWGPFDIGPGATIVRRLTARVATSLPQGVDSVVATASVSHDGSTGVDPSPANNLAVDHGSLVVPPDFVVSSADLGVTPSRPQPAELVSVELLVHNEGFVAGTAPVAIYEGRPGWGRLITTRTVTVSAGGSATVSAAFLATSSTVLISALVDPFDTVDELDETNNRVERFLVDAPDLAISFDNLNVSDPAPRAGDTVEVTVAVRNGGNRVATGAMLDVFAGEPEQGAPVLLSEALPEIPPAGNRLVQFSWVVPEGVTLLTAVADRADSLLELSEENNRVERQVVVARASGPDLSVAAIDRGDLAQNPLTLLAEGELVLEVANFGDGVAGPFSAAIFDDRNGDGRLSDADQVLARQSVSASLASGGTAELRFAMHHPLRFRHPALRVALDVNGEVEELDETNNVASVFADCVEAPVLSFDPIVEKWWVPAVEAETAPIVVQLNDDNGDGVVDSRDIPDVVFHTEDALGRAVTARSGLDGSEHWSFRSTPANPLATRLAHLAAADLDGDAVAEIIAVQSNARLLALDARGRVVWVSDAIPGGPTSDWSGGPTVGDLDADGTPEIAVGAAVLDHRGRFIARGTRNQGRNHNYYGPFGQPWPWGTDQQFVTIADIDLDGQAELLAGDTVYRLVDGELEVVWDHQVQDNLMIDGFSVAANLDGDPQAEIVYVSSGRIMVFNHDGSIFANHRRFIPLLPFLLPTFWGGAPTVADLDGDQIPEILVAGDTELVAMRAGLGVMWRKAIDERAAFTSATVFDLDGDGFAEVLYLDHTTFWILDGRTGTVRYSRPNTSKTATEYPVVADVDGDGRADVLVPSNRSFAGSTATQGLHVLSSSAWVGARSIWSQHEHHGTNILDDGTVPSPALPHWLSLNRHRADRELPPGPLLRANLTVGLPRVGAPSPDGVPITLRIGNGGDRIVAPGVLIRLFAGSDATAPIAAEAHTATALRPGSFEDLTVWWQVPGPAGSPAYVQIDPEGRIDDCELGDNTLAFAVTETVLPDLVVASGAISVPAQPVAGQLHAVTVAVTNQGPARSPIASLQLWDGDPDDGGILAAEGEIPALDPGAGASVALTWDSFGAAGGRVLWAVADWFDTLFELDETNNRTSAAVTLLEPERPDLALESVAVVPATVETGHPSALHLEVLNRGADWPGGFEIAVRRNAIEIGRLAAPAPWPGGERQSFTFPLDTFGLQGQILVEGRVDPGQQVLEQHEGNNVGSAWLEVLPPPVSTSIRTDRPAYRSNEEVVVSVESHNTTGASRELRLRVAIRDVSEAVAAVLADQVVELAPGQTDLSIAWSTGSYGAGPYTAVVELEEGGALVATARAPFSIAPDRRLGARLLADRSVYPANVDAVFSLAVTNEGVNDVLGGLTASLEVRAASGAQVFGEVHTVPDLGPGDTWQAASSWSVGLAVPGPYQARVSVRDSGGAGELLAYDDVLVTVEDSSQTGGGLGGLLFVEPALVGAGAPVLTRFELTNGGNADMPALVVAVRVERTTTGEEVFSTLVPLPIDRGSIASGEVVLATDDLEAMSYSVSLSAIVPAGTVLLDRADLEIAPGLSIGDVEVIEGNTGTTLVAVPVRLSSASAGEVTVAWATSDGTAVAGTDYVPTAGLVELAPGELEATVEVEIAGDLAAELDERALVHLSVPTGALIADGQSLVTILDDDGCASAELLKDPGLELATSSWETVSGLWQRGFSEPASLEGSFHAAAATADAELAQAVDLEPFSASIDAGGVEIAASAFLAGSGSGAHGAVIVDLLDVSGSVLGSLASGELELGSAWGPWSMISPIPPGARTARFRLLSGSSGSESSLPRFDLASLRILAIPSLEVDPALVVEGDSGTRPAVFQLRVSCGLSDPIEVLYAAVGGSALEGTDFARSEGLLVFGPGERTRTIEVEVVGDVTDEPDEVFALATSAPTGVALLHPLVAGTIVDDDGPAGLEIGDQSVVEEDGGVVDIVFTVALGAPSGKSVSVGYRTVGITAAAGSDFEPIVGRLMLPAGAGSGEIVVPVLGDRLDELDETLQIELFDPVEAEITRPAAIGTILDDDATRIAIAPRAVAEAEGPARFAVTLSHPSSREVRVDYTTEDITALAGSDYLATAGTLVFPPGVASAAIDVPLVDDGQEEPEEIFRVVLSNPVEAGLEMPEAVGSILDDDGVVITIADVVVREADEGTTNAVFRISFSRALPEPVSIGYRTVGGSAQAGTDYLESSGVLTAPVGALLAEILVPVVGDLVEEPLESFVLELFDAEGGVVVDDEATGTIVDNDGWRLNGLAEDLSRPGCITLTPATNDRRGSAWRTVPTDLGLNFDQTYRVFVGSRDAGADGIVYALQTQGLDALGGLGGGIGYVGVSPSIGVEIDTWGEHSFDHLAINLNGSRFHEIHPPVGATLDQADVEDGQEHRLRVIWNAVAKSLDVHFDDNERMVANRDLVATVFQGENAVVYGLTAATGAANNVHYFCETVSCYAGTGPGVVSTGDAHVTEGAAGTVLAHFPVTLACPQSQPTQVRFTTADGTARGTTDYLPASGIVRFEPGETSKTVSIEVLGDLEPEADEHFFVRLSDPIGAEIRYAEGVGTIRSDDFRVSAVATSIVEGHAGESWTVPVTVALNTPATAVTRVNYQATAVSATAAVDFVATSGQLTFQVGESSKIVNVTVRGDDLDEGDESFALVLSSPVGAALGDNALVSILDDDSCPGPNLLINPSAELAPPAGGGIPGWTQVSGAWRRQLGGGFWVGAREGSHFFYPGDVPEAELYQEMDVSSLGSWIDQGATPVRVEGFVYTTNGTVRDTARMILEYVSAAGVVLGAWDTGEIVNSGIWSRHAGRDVVPQGTRSLRLRLAGTRLAGDVRLDAVYDQLSVHLLGFPYVSVQDASTLEGEAGTTAMTFRVTRSCSVPFATVVDYLTADGTAKAGVDYQAQLGRVTFAATELAREVTVPIFGDAVVESDETFLLRIVSPINAGVDRGEAVGTIIADEVQMTIDAVDLPEGNSGLTPFVFTVSLSAPSPLPISVDWATGGGSATGAATATEGTDYLAAGGTLSFAPGETSKLVSVMVVGDSEVEPDETFRVTLTNPLNAVLIENRGYGTIIQDDIGITIHDGWVTEGDQGSNDLVVEVTLTGPSTVPVGIDFTTRDGSAVAGLDYVATSGRFMIPANALRAEIIVRVLGDTLFEPSETFVVDLSSPSAGSLLVATAQAIVADDDDCPSPELLANPGADGELENGEVPGWSEVTGTGWTRRTSSPSPFSGAAYFHAGGVAVAELAQDVDVSTYAPVIDEGIQRFSFEGFVRSAAEAIVDTARIVVEYRNQTNTAVLGSWDSGEIAHTTSWRRIGDLRFAPVGTRFVRVRLATTRRSGSTADGFFDALSLRSIGTPALSVEDVEVFEGDEESVVAPFRLRLSCPARKPSSVEIWTADDTATAEQDYISVSTVVHFETGESEKPVPVEIVGDYRNEIRERFLLHLGSEQHIALLRRQAVGTIRDADPGAPPVDGREFVYTLDEDFDLGAALRVNHDAPGSDQLQISPEGGTFPYVWVAASARGTMVKIDAETGEILGEYSTNPDNRGNSDPSRTTVGLDGSVWVGNRNDQSVTHVGLPELNQCVDRNGNGVIDTSTGYGDLLPWPNASGQDTNGGVSTAQDECILHYVKTSSSGTRHVSVTRDNDVWVSGTGNRVFNLISGRTGEILRTVTGAPCGGYGGLIDGAGVIWSTTSGSGLLRWDPAVDPPTAESRRCIAGLEPYGLAIDDAGWVWVSAYGSHRVRKVSPDGDTVLGPFGLGGSGNAQGLAVDGSGDVWVSSGLNAGVRSIAHLRNDGSLVGRVPDVPRGSTGIAIDHQGKVWAAAYQDSAAARIDPSRGALGPDGVTPIGEVDLVVPLPGAIPYNYSDMTGFIAVTRTAGLGSWTVIQDGGIAGAEWGSIVWNTEPEAFVPAGSSIEVEVRAAESVPALGIEPWQAIQNGLPFVRFGRYLQVRVTLRSNTSGQTPVLSDLRVGTTPDAEVTIADAAVAEGDGQAVEAVFAVELASPVNREVQVTWATADATAVAGEDYVGASGVLTFAPGETVRAVAIEILGDVMVEPDETFEVLLSSPVNAEFVRDRAIGTIIDDDARPELSLTKVALVAGEIPGRAAPGEVVAYRLVAQNVGSAPATELVLEDSLPPRTTLVPGSLVTSQGVVLELDPLRIALSNLEAGGAVQIDLELELDPVFPAGSTPISNQAILSSVELAPVPSDDPSVAGSVDPTVVEVVATPVLVVEKRAVLADDRDGDGRPSPGDELEYELVLRSSGDADLSELQVADPIPLHTTVVPGSIVAPAGTVIVGESPVELDLGELAVGSVATISFRVVIDPVLPAGVDRVTNQAAVASAELPVVLSDDPEVGGTADPTVTVVTGQPRLLAEKTWALVDDIDADGVPSPGDAIGYEVRLRNLGTLGATEVLFVDPIPEHTAVVEGSAETSAGSVVGEDPLRLELDVLEVGDEVVVHVVVRIDDPFPPGLGEVSNQGLVASLETDVVPTDDPNLGGEADPTVTPVTAAPRLRLEKVDVLVDRDGDQLASPGDELIYVLTLANDGNTAALAVELTDSIPPHTSLVAGSIVASAGTITGEDPIVLELPELGAGASVELSFRVEIATSLDPEVELIENQASASGEGVETVLSDDPRQPGEADPTVTPVVFPPQLSVQDASAPEAATAMSFVVTLSHSAAVAIEIPWSTVDRDALDGFDYTGASGILVLEAGAPGETIEIGLIDDLFDENDETLELVLGVPSYGSLERASATGTIIDDDALPELLLSGGGVVEGDGGTVDLTFTVALSAPSGRPVTVSLATADAGATAGVDYLPLEASLTLEPGQTVALVAVEVVGDLIDEDDEALRLLVVAVQHALPATPEAVGIIVDDDLPRVSIGDASVVEGDTGTADAVFPVTLSVAGRLPLTMAVQTEDESATAGVDYTELSGSLTFAPGEVEHELRVGVTGDLLLEPDETFRVVLSTPSYGELDRAVGLGTILDDEVCLGPNLLVNPGAELPEVGGELPGWQSVAGAGWARATTAAPVEGEASFAPSPIDPSLPPIAELVQDVDLQPWAGLIDTGTQRFAFEVWWRVADVSPSDLARVVLEYRAVPGGVVLGAFESDDLVAVGSWASLIEVSTAPLGARWVRVRLLAERHNADGPLVQFDDLLFASLRAATVTVGDTSVLEGDSGTTTLRFPVRLTCPLPDSVAVAYATSAGTATPGDDYQEASGTLTIASGEVEGEIPVPVVGDTAVEPDETVTLTLGPAGESEVVLLDPSAIGAIVNDDEDGGGNFCPRSPGYWKNHVSAWPVASLPIGAVTYAVPGALTLLNYGGPDSATKLARALVATKLNQASGYDSPGLAALVSSADGFLATYPPGSNPRGSARNTANALKDALEAHYQGECPDPPSACSPTPLGIATGWNVFVRGTLAQNYSDTEGRMAAGGDVQLNGYSVGLLEWPSPGTPMLVAGGHLLFVNGTVSGGDVVHRLSAQTASLNVPHGVIRQGTAIDFAAAGSQLEALSSQLAALPQQGIVTIPPWNAISLDGTNPERNVFYLTAAELQATSSVTIRVPAGSTVVVNVSGTAPVMQYFGFTLDGATAERIVWNFPQATSLTMQGVGVQGSVLAPRAAVQFNNGVIHGTLVASSLQGNGQSNRVSFTGCLPSP